MVSFLPRSSMIYCVEEGKERMVMFILRVGCVSKVVGEVNQKRIRRNVLC